MESEPRDQLTAAQATIAAKDKRFDAHVEAYEDLLDRRCAEYEAKLTASQARVAELEQWTKCAEEAMRKLIDASEQLNRHKLERALMGIKILLGTNQ